MNTAALQAERDHLANLLEAVQRCAYFLDSSSSSVHWPLDGPALALAAFNERFVKLQDTLAAAMRHSALLMGETTAPFLRVLALFVKLQVIESIESWQVCRTVRNMAAHAAARLLKLCAHALDVGPATADFEVEFQAVCNRVGGKSPAAG